MDRSHTDAARRLRDAIRRFDGECERSGETDTGFAWEILTDVEELLTDIVRSYGPKAGEPDAD